MSTRVGGPPRGAPPGGAKVGGAPKGAPPGGKGKKVVPGGPKGKAPGAPAASNANIPAAPAVKNYICFIKGEPFSGAAGAGDSTPAAGDDDLDLDAAADISMLLDGLDGGSTSVPFTLDEPTPSPQPSAAPNHSDMGNGGGLAAELAAMAAKIKAKSEGGAALPELRAKREDEMSFGEQIAAQREKIRKKAEAAEAAKAAEAE